VTTVDLSGPGALDRHAQLTELGQQLVSAAVAFSLAEDEMHRAEQVCGEIRSRVPPGVMPPPSVMRELNTAHEVSRQAFATVKKREATWKDIARKITKVLDGATRL